MRMVDCVAVMKFRCSNHDYESIKYLIAIIDQVNIASLISLIAFLLITPKQSLNLVHKLSYISFLI